MRNTKQAQIATLGILLLLVLPLAASAQGVMFVKNNRVGIGTDNPAYPLHVNSDAAGNEILLRLENEGAPFLNFLDTSNGIGWGLQPTGGGSFSITKVGSGGSEFLIQGNGQVKMGAPGGCQEFILDPNGNLTICGTLTENSSREFKSDFAALDRREILAQVADLEILEWSYKEQSSRHIGPMAEDFYAAFKLGASDNGLAPRDVAGVALVAVQELNGRVEEKDREIEQLRRELAELKAVVETLAAR